MRKRKPKGPHNKDKTHCPHGHPYAGANLLIYTSKKGSRRRMCRACLTKKSYRRYWDKLKMLKHPGKPGRPRKVKTKKGEV